MNRREFVTIITSTGLAAVWPAGRIWAAKSAHPADPAAALTQLIQKLLPRYLPDPLAQTSENWGQQKEVHGVRRSIRDWKIVSEPYHVLRNDGTWRRLTLRVPQAENIRVAVTGLQQPRPACLRGMLHAEAPCVELELEQQLWRNGLRLYGCTTRAHCRASVLLDSELTSRCQLQPLRLLPDYTIHVAVRNARLDYGDLTVDRIVGLEGRPAEFIGQRLREIIRLFKPRFEEQIRQKAEAAIVRALNERELHIQPQEWLQRLLRPS